MKKVKGPITTLKQIKTWQQYCVEKSITSSETKLFPVDNKVNSKLSLWKGDITLLKVDAIVNAAKSSLLGGGGIDLAIHAAAGKELLEECRTLNGAKPGEAKITKGYLLPASFVIHAVGPDDQNAAVLKSAYENSLNITKDKEYNITSIAFPCIATGYYGFPREKAAAIAANAVRIFLNDHEDDMERVLFVVFDKTDEKFYEDQLPKYFPIEECCTCDE